MHMDQNEGMMSKILVVDDQAYMRHLIAEILIADGYEVQAVGDKRSMKEVLMSAQPDLVLLDLYLDGPEGFALLRDIKRQYPYLPVIIFTAYDTYSNDPRLDEADGYLVKSVEFWDELKQRVAGVLRIRRPVHGTSERKIPSPGLLRTATDRWKMIYERP
jgi:DNA-binding response OmpR family regulator